MSRPLSRKGSGKGKSKSKVKKKTPKQQIAELTEQNETLTRELETLKTDAGQTRDRMDTVTNKLVSSVRRQDFGISDAAELQCISNSTLTDIIDKLVVKRQIHEVSVEERVENLEGRITDMSMDLAKMTTKTSAYEMGLADLTKCDDMGKIKDKIYGLQLIAGQQYQTFTANDPTNRLENVLNGYHDNSPSEAVRSSLKNAHTLNLTQPPKKKALGETHISRMNGDLRLYVIQELSLEKASGGDWRRFAERVGIPEDVVSEWKSLKMRYPMGHVLTRWSQESSATVRMLHRNLISPQMRCTIVAKRVADFYEVD